MYTFQSALVCSIFDFLLDKFLPIWVAPFDSYLYSTDTFRGGILFPVSTLQ